MTAEQKKDHWRTTAFGFLLAFLFVMVLPYPTLAVVLALVVAVAMVAGAAALNVRDANRRVERAVAEEVSR